MANPINAWSNPLTAGGSTPAAPKSFEELYDTGNLESPRRKGFPDRSSTEDPFDRLTRVAAALLHAPIALVSLVESDHEFLKSSIGLPEHWASPQDMQLAPPFCAKVVASHEPLIINDAHEHRWFEENPVVDEVGAAACLAIPLRTPDGKAVGYFCVMDRATHYWSAQDVQGLRDLAGMAMSEIALQAHARERDESQQVNRSIGAMPAELYLYDFTQRRTIFSNHYAARVLGYSIEEFYTRGFFSHLHYADLAAAREHITAIEHAHDGECRNWEFRLRDKNDQWHWFRSSDIVFQRGIDGSVEQVLGIAVEVTEQKRAEEILLETEERQRLAIYAAKLAYWSWDIANNSTTLLGSRQELFGRPEDAPFGSMRAFLEEAVHPDDRAAVHAALASSVQDMTPLDIEFRVVWPNGEIHWLAAKGNVTCSQTGIPECMRGVIFDITERKQAEELLRAADRRKTDFLATLGHELRNPLSAIRSAALMLEADFGEETLQWVRGVIERQTNQLARLVDDLLDVSRISRGKVQLRKERVEVSDIVRRAAEAVRSPVEQRQHLLLLCLSSHPLVVEADPSRLEQICVNLLNNAVKYSDDGAHIRVSTDVENGCAVIRVRDNGIGIAPEMVSRIFNLFEQVHTSINRSHGGLGIGLSLVKKLVELHGGSVRAFSEGLGKGSEFTVSLPLLADQNPPASSNEGSPAAHVGAGRRILIVDDHEDTAHGLTRLLKRRGYDVQMAHDGQSALDCCSEFEPEVVLLDIGLPDFNGFTVAKRIRQMGFNKTALIAVSGFGNEDDRVKAKEAGFDHHLVKPVDMQTLLLLLEERHA